MKTLGPRPRKVVMFALLALTMALSFGCRFPLPNPVPTPGPVPTPTPILPTPPPLAMGCEIPQIPAEDWIGPGPEINALGGTLALVMSHLTGCEPQSDCPHGEGAGFEGSQRWHARVIACLRDPRCLSRAIKEDVARGLCAGQHETGHTDEITLGDRGESHHIANVGGGKVVWPPPWGRSVRPSWRPRNGYPQPGAPLPSPAPSASPTPAPGPTPGPVGACPLPWGPGRWVQATIENIGNPPQSQQVSVATKWCSEVDDRDPNTGRMAPPNWEFECGTKCCRIGEHEGKVGIACEMALFGRPTWTADKEGVRIVPLGNPFNLKIAEGEGRIGVCGSVTQPNGTLPCTSAKVRAQPGPVVN